ncbi:hypothetical protein JCM8547_000826 [Rhodosporidiobolus lusitaniae]
MQSTDADRDAAESLLTHLEHGGSSPSPGWRASDTRRAPLLDFFKFAGTALLCFGLGLAWARDRSVAERFDSAGGGFLPTVEVNLTGLRENPYAPLPPGLANLRTFNHEQCDAAFPLLWPEVDWTVAAFRHRIHPGRNGITEEDLDEVERLDGTRVSVVGGQLYVKRFHGEWTLRSEAMLNSLQMAIKTAPAPGFPDVEFVFRCTDNLEPGAHFGLTKSRGEAMWLLPDFGFESWPEPRVLGWQDARRKAMDVDSTLTWEDKETKLFWRGAYLGAPLREQLGEIASREPWGDVGTIDWGAGAAGRINMEDHCRKKFLADADSHSYSGRLKYLLLCRSVVVTHRKKWVQHFHGALDSRPGSPTQNWVELSDGGWTRLGPAMEKLIADPEEAERIAENAVRTMRDRYMTPASVACYWRRILTEYATLQQFKPTPGGIDFESFNLVRQIDYTPY